MKIHLFFIFLVFFNLIIFRSFCQESNLFTTPQVEEVLKRLRPDGTMPLNEESSYQSNKKVLKQLKQNNPTAVPDWFNEQTIEQAHQAGMSYRFKTKLRLYWAKSAEEEGINTYKDKLLDSSVTQITEQQADDMGSAALSLGMENRRESIPRLVEIIKTETYPLYPARIFAARALLQMNETSVALPFLKGILADNGLANIHDYGIYALGKSQNRDALQFLFQFLSTTINKDYILAVIEALKSSELPEAKRKLEEMLNDAKYEPYKERIYDALAQIVIWEADRLGILTQKDLEAKPDYEKVWKALDQKIIDFKKAQSEKSTTNKPSASLNPPTILSNPAPIASTATNAVVPLAEKAPELPMRIVLFIIGGVVLLGGMIYWLIRR